MKQYELINDGSAYNPKAEHNIRSWDFTRDKFVEAGGVLTHDALITVLKQCKGRNEKEHTDFLGYLIKRGAIQESGGEVTPEPAAKPKGKRKTTTSAA